LVVRGSPVDTELYRSGDIVIQDGGSQLVPLLLGVSRGDDDDDDVLDVCAAPGGKTSILAEDTRASVFAFDARYSRARLLRDTTLRAGSTNVHVGVADGRLLPFSRRFPRILLDVPCSSLGTLRRNPDIKWRVAESDLAGFAAVQRELLARASAHLEPYGRLAYATCSTEPEENEGVVQEFLSSDAGSGFRLLDPSPSLPAEARHFVGEDGCYRTFPERDGIDAYFAAILTR
jgi:16S rRNA (cytosine967-C5)-methyltransferase